MFHSLDVGGSAAPLREGPAAVAQPPQRPLGSSSRDSPALAGARHPSGALSAASTPRPQTGGGRWPSNDPYVWHGPPVAEAGRATRLQAAAGADSLSAFEQRHA